MNLRLRLGAYLLVLHLLLFGAAALLLIERPVLFVAAEALLLASLAGGFFLLRQALEPLGYTRRFHDLLQDQHYANRLAPPASRELEELVTMFNTMLAALHRERLAAGEQQGFLDRLLEATPSAVLVFDFDGAISLVNASALDLLGIDEPRGRPLRAWLAGEAPLARGLDERARQRSLDLIAQLDALPQGESRLLTDTAGRRYRAQRGQFYDRGFARHFLMVEELTMELEDSERATYARLVRVLAHEVNNTVAATRSVLDSLLFYRGQLAARTAPTSPRPSRPSSGATSAWANSSTASRAWSRCRRRSCVRCRSRTWSMTSSGSTASSAPAAASGSAGAAPTRCRCWRWTCN